MWAYTFDVVHDVEGLVERRGGRKEFVEFLDEHFDGGECSVCDRRCSSIRVNDV